ncbi:MAG: hypothetical protein AAB382_01965 [Chloroflexota bacterium]|jgi:hypothetical protein
MTKAFALSSFVVRPSSDYLMPNEESAPANVLSETDNYVIYTAEEFDGETTYHVELDKVTLHFFKEEFEEFLRLVKAVKH